MNRIPNELMNILKPNFKPDETVILSADADRDADSGFCDVWLIATNINLYVCKSDKFKRKTFRGFVNRVHLSESFDNIDYSLYTVSALPMSSIDSLEIIPLIAGSQLTYVYNSKNTSICFFTNAKAKDIGSFVVLFNRYKDNGFLSVDDLKVHEKGETCPKCGMLFPTLDYRVCPRCNKKGATMLRILKIATPFKWMMITVYLLMILSSVVGLFIPILQGEMLYDGALTPGNDLYGKVLLILLLIIAFGLLQTIIKVTYGIINVRFSAKLIYKIKTMVFSAMQRLSLSFFMDKQTGSLMTRVNSDASEMQHFFVDGLSYIITNIVIVVGATVIMLIKDWQLMLMCYIPVLIIVFYLKRKFNILRRINWRRFRRRSTVNSVISDTIKGSRVVKAFGREEDEIIRFSKINNSYKDIEISYNKQINTLLPINALVINLGGIIIWAFGGAQIFSGVIQYGMLMTFINYINMIYGPVSSLGDFVNWWANCMTSAQRIFEVVDSDNEVKDAEFPIAKDSIEGKVSIRNVSFGYDINKYVIKNISFDIEPGTMTGIVGHSGAGKSTLVNLISRLYDVNEGSILIDDVNIKDYSFKDLRKNIGIVSQEVYVFMGSVLDNIAYAKPGCSREEVVAAAKTANAHDFIEKLPDGYDTFVGPGGHDLSGGEKQRLSIARAILLDPKILILDEATASLDTETERLIQEGLEKLICGRTTIAIAHRLSTLRNADYIVVMDNGMIIEQGKHMDLMLRKGDYFRQIQKQTEALKFTGL